MNEGAVQRGELLGKEIELRGKLYFLKLAIPARLVDVKFGVLRTLFLLVLVQRMRKFQEGRYQEAYH